MTVPYRLLVCLYLLILPGIGYCDALGDGFKAYNAGHYSQAYKLWKPLANDGNADAQYNIGLLLKNGKGVEQNHRLALYYFLDAAKQGLADAQYNAGVMFRKAEGISRSNKDAVVWWQRAAAQGLTPAQHNLAVMYAYGIGVKVENKKAIALWKAAAQKGYEESKRALFVGYSKGYFGLPKDPIKAEQWRKTLAKQSKTIN